MQIEETSAPEGSLIAPFAAAEGHYADAFRIADFTAELPDFIQAFYTTPLFKAERLVLRVTGGLRSSDAEAAALAGGDVARFAAWTVEGRGVDEILLGDISGRTKSWLSVAGGDLWFGSVVVPVERRGKLVLGPVFDSLVGAHKLYSRMLLASAAGKLKVAAAN